MTKFAWASFTPIGAAKRIDPQAVGEALEEVKHESGELKPYLVVDAAKDVKSVLHGFFEWNDAKAAAAHRIDQARLLIRSVRVVDEGDATKSRPAFLSITAGDGTSYRSLEEVLSSANLRLRLLEQAARDLDSWQQRYAELKEIVSLVEPAKIELRKRLKKGAAEEARS